MAKLDAYITQVISLAKFAWRTQSPVERTFAWMGRNRRLAKDYEYLPENSMAYLYLAMPGLMLRRIKKRL